MSEYAFVWRFLPKMVVGAAFLFVAVVGVMGIDALVSSVHKFVRIVAGLNSELAAIIVVILTTAIVLNLGSALVGWLSSAIRLSVGGIIYRLIKNRMSPDSTLMELVSPIQLLVQRNYIKHKSFYQNHFRLKSIGDEKLDQREAINKHYKEVEQLLDSIPDWNLVCAQSYQESLSQDQRKIEIMEDELALTSSFQLVMFLASVVFLFQIPDWSLAVPLAL